MRHQVCVASFLKPSPQLLQVASLANPWAPDYYPRSAIALRGGELNMGRQAWQQEIVRSPSPVFIGRIGRAKRRRLLFSPPLYGGVEYI